MKRKINKKKVLALVVLNISGYEFIKGIITTPKMMTYSWITILSLIVFGSLVVYFTYIFEEQKEKDLTVK